MPMKIKIVGYTDVNAYKTIRCEAILNDDTITEKTIFYTDHSTDDGICIQGKTNKPSRWSPNNPVEIILHGMTAGEALILASRLTEYARLQRHREKTEELEAARNEALKALASQLSQWSDDWAALTGQAPDPQAP